VVATEWRTSLERGPGAAEGPGRESGSGSGYTWFFSSGFAPLVLVVFALLGSVVIPARQTWLITKLLRETTETLAPARLLLAQLQSGLAEEIGTLQGYALSGDTASLDRYRQVAAENERRLATLENQGGKFDASFAAHLETVRRRVDEWRQYSARLVAPGRTAATLAAEVPAAQARYDASLAAIASLSSDLSADAMSRDIRVRELEHLSLFWNAGLVLAAFAALYSVAILTLRERRLAASLRRRVEEESSRARQESALREAAEALAGAFTIDEVTQRIAHSALEAIEGRGAFVERITTLPNETSATLRVGAVAGTGVPLLESSCEFAGSYTERVLASGEPALIPGPGKTDHPMLLSTLNGAAGPAIVVPLMSAGTSMGALFVLTRRGHVRTEDVARAAIFGHLAALAYEKVRLLDEAIDGRLSLERVITSRSRLMRGFSHDVKNPIGAADGYAELLSDGVYGDLNAEQQEGVARMRRCMHGALSLIDDLHELARAETGHLSLHSEPVNVADLIGTLGEEYQATAVAGGLSFSASVAADVGTIQTSKSRVRQIVSNLLSNAIKYTDSGSVLVRAEHRSDGAFPKGPDWLTIEVSDTGRGVPPEKLDFIFQEFGRIDGDKTGAGLGLAISRLLAQALGAHITVTSELGCGSTFTLWLPRDVV
jgi:signal transduction histidine kinase